MSHETKSDKYTKKVRDFSKTMKVTLLSLIIVTFGITVVAGTFDVVESGHAKIAVEPNGEIKGPITGGWHLFWCNPFSTKYDFIIRAQSVQYSNLHADTLDGHVNIDITVSYKLGKENVASVFELYGATYQSYVDAVIQSAFRDAFASNTMRSVALENRTQIQLICEETIEENLHEYFVDLLSLKVQNILLPTAFSDAQIQTQIAYENLRAANITAQIHLLEANTAAEVKMIEAVNQNNITLLQANTTAEALEIVVQNLNVTGNITENHLLTYLYLQQLPTLAEYGNVIIITDGSVPFVVDVPDNTNSTG
jgi:regulator of protease activity HflC (stomatin/prohibitin superfamily)